MRDSTPLPHTTAPAGRLWDPVNKKGNYDNNRAPIDMIILHTMEGTLSGSTSHFKRPTTNTLAHYGIGLDGSLVQWTTEKSVAYHAGDYEINRRAIGLEHEDGYNPQTRPNAINEPRPDALYETSIKLVADICTHYGISIDKDHIKRHREVSQTPKSCPGTLDIDRIINGANALVSGSAGEEAMVSHMMKPSVFALMVTKSTNWDDLCASLEIPKSASESHGMGSRVYEMIQGQLEQAKRDATPPETPDEEAPQGTPDNTAGNGGAGNQTPQVPPTGHGVTPAPTAPKTVWEVDVFDVLKDILESLKGRVTFK